MKKKMKYIMTAESTPHNFERWFDSFVEGSEFEAASLEEAQRTLDELCATAGTNTDRNYGLYAPIAEKICENTYIGTRGGL